MLRGCYRVDADPGDPPADLNLYVTADARVLIFRERARDNLDTGYLCRARRSCRIPRRYGGAQAANGDDDRPDIRSPLLPR